MDVSGEIGGVDLGLIQRLQAQMNDVKRIFELAMLAAINPPNVAGAARPTAGLNGMSPLSVGGGGNLFTGGQSALSAIGAGSSTGDVMAFTNNAVNAAKGHLQAGQLLALQAQLTGNTIQKPGMGMRI